MDGKRYIRVIGRRADDNSRLSTGEQVEKGKSYWVQVEPIEWLMDPSGTMVAKKCLFAGIQFDRKEEYYGDFSKTFMKQYLDTYFAKEMEPSDRSKGKTAAEYMEEMNRQRARQKRFGLEVEDAPMSVSEKIKYHIQNGFSFMLHGPSGVGKSQRVKDIDPNLTSITLCNGIMPEEVKGRTIFSSGKEGLESGGVWVPPAWYTDLCKKCEAEPDKKHVLFIDEVTNANEKTQSLIYHIAQDRCIEPGVGKLPDNAVVVLAGNSKEESGAAYNMPAPLFRRVDHIYLDLDIKSWLEWAKQPSKKHPEDPERLNIHPFIAAFVEENGKDVFYSGYDEEDPSSHALDPRKWERVSDKIYENNGVIRREVLEASIGREMTDRLLKWAEEDPEDEKQPPLPPQEDRPSEGDQLSGTVTASNRQPKKSVVLLGEQQLLRVYLQVLGQMLMQ